MDLGNPWYDFAYRVRRGESSKDELIALLRRNHPMPTEAQPFVADLLGGKRKYAKTGPASEIKEQDMLIVYMVLDAVERYLVSQNKEELAVTALLPCPPSDGDLTGLANEAKAIKAKNASPYATALEFVAKGFGVSDRTLMKELKKYKELWSR